jgi:hypothetical protein
MPATDIIYVRAVQQLQRQTKIRVVVVWVWRTATDNEASEGTKSLS